MLNVLEALSHEFGGERYVRGGGGNTSCKDGNTVWVKPSGTTLATIRAEQFVALDRAKVRVLFETPTPQDSAAREELVKNVMAAAVRPESKGRPSVEAPLHESFDARFVVHTHPALVNGLTCAKNSRETCAKLFPDALYVPYIDPGYTLCMQVRGAMKEYRRACGRQPSMLFLENHGVFVAGDTEDEIRAQYAAIMKTLQAEYDHAGVATTLSVAAPEASAVTKLTAQIKSVFGDKACVATGGMYRHPEGPITPDHIVYSKSYHLTGELTAATLAAFEKRHGYKPRVVIGQGAVAGVGDNEKTAALALELSLDGALVQRLATVFGGIRYMSDAARLFIENWEVESYRQKVSAG